MKIEFYSPLHRAYLRMKAALFQPFNLRNWMVIGFTAFLAGLLDGGGGGSGGNMKSQYSHFDLGDLLGAPYTACDWLHDNPEWMSLVIGIMVLIIAIIVVLLWLSSRGKFMFLDNVVQNRALVSQPWHEYHKEGNSLFYWRLIFTIISMTIILGTIYHVWQMAYEHYQNHYDLWGLIPSLIQWGLFLLIAILGLTFIGMLLDNFIAPIMYKNRISSVQAWDLFLSLFWKNLGTFILYGLFLLVLYIVVVTGIIILGLLTCCIGFILLVLPYINAVVLLPVSYTFRAFSLEFMAQFGEDYKIFPE